MARYKWASLYEWLAEKIRDEWTPDEVAMALLQLAQSTSYSEVEEEVANDCDLLVDLAHFCDRRKLDMLHELRRTKGHYFEETDRQGKQLTELPDAPAEQPQLARWSLTSNRGR